MQSASWAVPRTGATRLAALVSMKEAGALYRHSLLCLTILSEFAEL